jgi:hypothetical protein
LRREPDTRVEEVEGERGEFTVLVDGRVVAQKHGDRLPTVEEVVGAMENAAPAHAGAAH